MSVSLSKHINIETLPTIPHTLLELIRLFDEPYVEFNALADAVRQDPVVTARVFSLANSVYFRQWNKTSNLKQLLVVLGVEPVLQIALLCATEQIFSQNDNKVELPIITLWYRSVLCANIAEEISSLVGYESKQEAYLGGLLHRLGQWVLMSNEPQHYLDEIDTTLDLKKTETLERHHFNTTSSEIGAKVMRQWEVCPFIANAIELQTQPPENLHNSTQLIRILALSRILSEQNDPESAGSIYAASRIFELNNDVVQQIIERARTRTNSIIVRFSAEDGELKSASGAELLEKSRQRRQMDLQTEVKSRTMANIMRMHAAEHEDLRATLTQIRRDFSVLFGLEDLCFLIADLNHNSLYGFDDLDIRPELNQIRISFNNDISFAMNALYEERTCCSSDANRDKLSETERELENMLGSKTLCFIPMNSGTSKKGLIVAPISPCQTGQFTANHILLRHAGKLSAEALKKVDEARLYKERRQQNMQLSLRATAHETNNPLTIINNYLHLLSEELETEITTTQKDIIQREIGRVSTMAAGLNSLSRKSDRKREHVQINTLIEKLVELLNASLFEPRQLRLHVKLDNNLESIASVAGNLKQVIINILKNSSEALTPGGEVWITTTDRVYKNQRQYVEIVIMDNGPGIDENIFENLFEPVNSTKEGHSGLGLTIVKYLVDDIDGEISCSSSSSGTRFQILLPRVLA